MNSKDLRPISQLVQRFGVKILAYGGPGEGKTPMILTAPRPVALITEPGTLSIANSNIPAWLGYTAKDCEAFFKWAFSDSADLKNFDTICVDSLSQMAENSLVAAQSGANRDGRAHYGIMSKQVMEWVDGLFFLPNKHVYLIAKQGVKEDVTTTLNPVGMPVENIKRTFVPYFPGQDLNVKIPHRYDEILHIGKVAIPGIPGLQPAARTKGNDQYLARDRSGKLAEFEPTNLANIIQKCMS